MADPAHIALNRFGLGARANIQAPSDPKRHLLDQIARYNPRPAVLIAQPSREALMADLIEYRMVRRERKEMSKTAATAETPEMMQEAAAPARRKKAKADGANNPARALIRDNYTDAILARTEVALSSDTDFAERLVHFWANHFAVSADKPTVTPFVGNFEFEAIRPHVMGKFLPMLRAAVFHPAMLFYLDQAQSIGPNSGFAKRASERRGKDFGLNENLAREILELHTLGVRSVYTQADVTEFARALTGVTVAGFGRGPMQKIMQQNGTKTGDTIFLDAIHEPGNRSVIGKSYTHPGATNRAVQAEQILADIAVHPATARHIATKLARHFVADDPPPSLVEKLADSFLKSGGDLPAVYRTLIAAPESWSGTASKFKTPWEWTISALRALDIRKAPLQNLPGLFGQMGQQIWKPGSPKGFGDVTRDWAGPAALMRRVETANRLAALAANKFDARSLAPQILPGAVNPETLKHISRAESPEQGLAMLLVAPEFLRR
jgi:uncharacterized protein (DUF1800 family)